MKYHHLASPRFWTLYEALPNKIRALADKNFVLLKSDPHHPSHHFKRLSNLWSVRVGEHYRAPGIEVNEGVYWFWIGSHAEYDRIIGRSAEEWNTRQAQREPVLWVQSPWAAGEKSRRVTIQLSANQRGSVTEGEARSQEVSDPGSLRPWLAAPVHGKLAFGWR
jgi:hypothetical protein